MNTIITNNIPRPLIEAYELTTSEREEFDYLNWSAVEDGSESATFFRYKGRLYDLGEFETTRTLLPWNTLRAWDGFQADSFFSGILIRYSRDFESVTVGRYYS